VTDQHRAAGRIGGLVKASRYDPQDLTAAARKGFLARFLDAVDPEGVLPMAERQRRAEALKKAYFVKLAMRSAETRRRRKARRRT